MENIGRIFGLSPPPPAKPEDPLFSSDLSPPDSSFLLREPCPIPPIAFPSAPMTVPRPARPGRKPMFAEFPEPQRKALYKALRTEKNRRSARQCRARRQNHIESLEAEVRTLKSRLAKYELIERQRDPADAEDQRVFEAAVSDLDRIKAESDPARFSDFFVARMDEKLLERQHAMEQLSRIMVEIAVPFSLRVFLWGAEKGVRVCEPEHMREVFGCALPKKEDWENIAQGCPDVAHCQAEKENMVGVLGRVRKNVKQILAAQKEIQLDTWRVWKFITADFIPRHMSGQIADSTLFRMKLLDRPELGDYALFHLSDNDFGFGGSADKWLDRFGQDLAGVSASASNLVDNAATRMVC